MFKIRFHRLNPKFFGRNVINSLRKHAHYDVVSPSFLAKRNVIDKSYVIPKTESPKTLLKLSIERESEKRREKKREKVTENKVENLVERERETEY